MEVLEEYNMGDGRAVSCRNIREEASCIDLPLLPYRDYICRDQNTGEKFAVQLSVPGRVRVMIPGGYDGTLRVRFEEPWYWRMAEAVSVLALLFGVAGILVRRRKVCGHTERRGNYGKKTS